MNAATWVFLALGGLGVLLLALALVGVEWLDFLGLDDLPGVFSLEVVAGFLGAFGFVAAIVTELSDPRGAAGVGLATAVGLLAALPAAYLAFRLARAVRRMPTDATPRRADLVGALGVVVTPIPAEGYGEVRVRLAGQQVKFNARAGAPIPLGARVFVVQAASETSVVVEPHP